MQIISNISLWYILLFLLLAGIITTLSYFRNNQISLPKLQKYTLASLRFLSVFFISVLLLSILLRIEQTTLQKSNIILLHDNSQSIKLANKNLDKWNNDWGKFANKLSDKYNVITQTFGDNLSNENTLLFDEPRTNISNALFQIRRQYDGKNLHSVILVSDGIYTDGENPYIIASKYPVPINTIILGDTNIYQDISIKNINHNSYAYLGNQFPIEIEIKSNKSANTTAILTIEKNAQTIFEKEIFIDNDNFFQTIKTSLKAEQTGHSQYIVSIKSNLKEKNFSNNISKFIIEVLDNRKRILLLSAAPHPDITCLRQIIESNDKYELEYTTSLPKKNNNNYDLVIFAQIPSIFNNVHNQIISDVIEKNIPSFWLFGNSTNINAFNKLNLGISINLSGNVSKNDESFVSINDNFVSFQISENIKKELPYLPPISVPFAKYNVSENSNILLYQKIHNVTTQNPVLLFAQQLGNRNAVWIGEGLWRWRLSSFLKNNSHENFDELINKSIQYLSAYKGQKKFNINVSNLNNETEPIIFEAELYDEAYEFINNADIMIDIKDKDGNVFPFVFSPNGNSYHLNAGRLPAGEYTYEAKSIYKAITNIEKGRFSVNDINVESIDLKANEQLLGSLAKASGGELYEPENINTLQEHLLNDKNNKPVAISDINYHDLINLKYYALAILLLLFAEWFLRRFWGNY
ncbi:hypothetical protein FACS1894153_3750 [Bacteroidia bacterium]|nr:hypothetical protein FACS1894153_3750 [Bacteroidia bacterium]